MHRNTFEAHCYASQSAHSELVEVSITPQGQLSFQFQQAIQQAFFDDLTISSRLGNTPRFLDLPNGLRLETTENELIDSCINAFSQAKTSSLLLHSLEKNLKWVFVLLIVVVAATFSTYRYGIPTFSKLTSPLVPDQLRELASEHTLRQMDQLILEDTRLFSYEQAHYRALLLERLQPLLDERQINLHFRNSPAMGANAFALPDGTIVFTDQLINQLTDDEFLAIAAHELGHVAGDHGMRSVISSTTLLTAITLVTGDSEAISEILVTAPTLLMQLSYSRALETEADNLAMSFMKSASLDFEHYATAMEKILHEHDVTEDKNDWMTYFSTHPEPYERIAKFRSEK